MDVSGPGAITPDGCSVEVYSLLEQRDELAMVEAVAPPALLCWNWAQEPAG